MITKGNASFIAAALVAVASAGCGVSGGVPDQVSQGNNQGNSAAQQDEPTDSQPQQADTSINLASIPDFASIIGNSTAHTAKAVIGTPPPFSTITSRDAGLYFFGDLLRSRPQPATQADWSTRFAEGMTKCQLVQGNAWAFSTLGETSRFFCYMREALQNAAFSDVRGNLRDQRQIFSQEEETKIIKVHMGDGGHEDNFGLVRVIGKRETTNLYEIQILSCSNARGPVDYHHLVVDPRKRLTYAGRRRDPSPNSGYERQAVIAAPLIDNGNGGLAFDGNAPRTMALREEIHGTVSVDDRPQFVDQSMNLLLGLSTTEEEMASLVNVRQPAGSFAMQFYSLFDYSGSNYDDLSFLAGSGASNFQQLDRQGLPLGQSFSADGRPGAQVIATEYRETAIPRYTTVNDSALRTIALDAATHFSGALSLHTAPDASFDYRALGDTPIDIAAEARADGFSCDAPATYEVVFNMNAAHSAEVMTACAGTLFHSNICNAAWSQCSASTTVHP